jgi:hypothetical protein
MCRNYDGSLSQAIIIIIINIIISSSSSMIIDNIVILVMLSDGLHRPVCHPFTTTLDRVSSEMFVIVDCVTFVNVLHAYCMCGPLVHKQTIKLRSSKT